MRLLIWAILLSCGLACASLKEAIDEFHQGDYAHTKDILGKDNYNDNVRAQLYLLAVQDFGSVDRAPATVEGLKSHIAHALATPRHKDHIAALLVQAFWNMYSENSEVLLENRNLEEQQPLRLSARQTHYGTTDDLGALEEGRLGVAQEEGGSMPFGAPLDPISLQDIEGVIHNSHHFPIPDLFEGTPNIAQGVSVLRSLCRERLHHAFYFFGAYVFSLDGPEKKAEGLGLITTAASLNNAESMRLVKQLMGQDLEPGWAHNFKAWICCGGPAFAKRFYCGGDTTERWWVCNLGFCGCSSRWSLGELCFNAKHVTRQGLGLCAAAAGFGLIITQQLASNDLIDLSQGWQHFIGWFGLFLSGGGVAVSHTKKND